MTTDLLILISLLAWGAWGIFEKKALDSASPQEICIALFSLSVLQIPVLLLLLSILQPGGWQLAPPVMFWSLVSGSGYVVAVLSYLVVLKHVDASFVYGFTAGYPVVAVLGAILILGEPFVLSRLLGIFIVVGGIYAIGSSPLSSTKKAEPDSKRLWAMSLLVLTTFCFGMRGVVDKIAVNYGQPLEIFLGKSIWDALFLVLIFVVFKRRGYDLPLRSGRMWFYCFLSSLMLSVGGISYLFAMNRCAVSYVVGITSCYPLIMYALALVFLKERFNRLRLCGIVLLISGLLVIRFC